MILTHFCYIYGKYFSQCSLSFNFVFSTLTYNSNRFYVVKPLSFHSFFFKIHSYKVLSQGQVIKLPIVLVRTDYTVIQ